MLFFPIFIAILPATLLPLALAGLWILMGGIGLWGWTALAATAIVLAILGAWAASHWIDEPLHRLEAGLERLARGELGEPVSGSSGRSLGSLLVRCDRVMDHFTQSFREMEERFLQEKAKVENLVNNIPDGIVMANLRGEVLYINQAAMKILGIKPSEVTAMPKGLFELIRETRLRSAIQKILEQHTYAEIIELTVEEMNGPVPRYFHSTVTLFPMPGEQGFGILLMMRDVTVERELAQMKEEFFHSIAHDLRAPVFAVQGYLRLLEKNIPADPKTKGYFSAIYQSCEKLLLFIQDILDAHRMDSGHLKLNLTALEPINFLERMKTLYLPVAEEKGIALEANLPTDYPGSMEGDDRLLERVFHNLISNALKFTSRGGRVKISVAQAGKDQIEFAVADTGSGIPKEKLALVFEKFQQLETGGEKSGYGLGLNICRKIVELHHGRIWVQSEVGRGSEFIFRLPRTQPTVSSPIPSPLRGEDEGEGKSPL